MSYNEIIEYYIPKNIRRLLESDNIQAQKLGVCLCSCPIFVIMRMDISPSACGDMNIPQVDWFEYLLPAFEPGGIFEEFCCNNKINDRHLEYPTLFSVVTLKLIDLGILPYNKEIVEFLTQKIAEYTSLNEAEEIFKD